MPIHRKFQNNSLKGSVRATHSERSFGRLRFALRGTKGFSLVEVTMALGIIAFSFLVIFGLLGTGLTAFRQSKGVTVSSQIAQAIFAQVAVMPFNTLTGSTPGSPAATYYQLPNPSPVIGGTTRYFDEQGNETTAANAVYWVNIRVLTSTPFVGVTTVTNANLATITIQVAFNPGHLVPDLGTGTTTGEWTGTSGGIPLQTYTYTAFVAQSS